MVLNNHIGKGGHLSSQPMGALRDYVSKDPVTERYSIINFPVLQENPYCIDIEETEKLLERFDPELIILGKSMILHPEPVADIKKIIENKSSNRLFKLLLFTSSSRSVGVPFERIANLNFFSFRFVKTFFTSG